MVTTAVVVTCSGGCWWNRRGDVGFAYGPVVSETYRVNGKVLVFGQAERPLAGARVTAFFRDRRATRKLPGTATWVVPERTAERSVSRGGVVLGRVTGSLPHQMAIASAVTDGNGRFELDVDRHPPRKGWWSYLAPALFLVSSEAALAVHNRIGVLGHDHWVVELRVEKDGYRPAHVFVRVPQTVVNHVVPITPGDPDYFLDTYYRGDDVTPRAPPIEIHLVRDGGCPERPECRNDDAVAASHYRPVAPAPRPRPAPVPFGPDSARTLRLSVPPL